MVDAPPFSDARPVTVSPSVVVIDLAFKALDTNIFVVEATPDTERFVVVPLRPVKFWIVVEPTTNKSPELLIVVVAVPPT